MYVYIYTCICSCLSQPGLVTTHLQARKDWAPAANLWVLGFRAYSN